MRIKKKIIVNIADGLHYRMFYESGFLNKLQNEYNVTLVCYNSELRDLMQESQKNIDILKYDIQIKYKKLLELFLKLNALRSVYYFPVMNVKSRRKRNIIKHLLVSNVFTSQIARLLGWTLRANIATFMTKSHFKIEADVVLLSTPGQKIEDLFAYFQLLKSNKTPLFKSLIYSWDNLSAKGFLPIKLKDYFVWNKYMQNDLVVRHGVSSNSIKVVGSPLAVIYSQYDKLTKSDCRQLVPYLKDKHESKFIILISTIPPVYYGKCHRRLINFTDEVMRELTDEFLIIVRPHPFDDTDYNDLICEHVCLDDNERSGTKEQWIPIKNSARNLHNRIKSADLNVNIASTITLEATYLGTKVINWCVDFLEEDYQGSLVDYYSYEHYKEVVKFSNIVPIATSCASYKAMLIERFVSRNNEMDSCDRLEFINHHFGPYKGFMELQL